MKNKKINLLRLTLWGILIISFCSTAQAQDRTACLCAMYSPNTVTFINTSTGVSQSITCGSSVVVADIGNYTFTPNFACSSPGPGCMLTYSWKITGPGPTAIGTTSPFGYNFVNPGMYTVIITPACGGTNCPPCTVKVVLTPCACGSWKTVPVTISGGPKLVPPVPLNPNIVCNTSKVIKPGTYTLSGHYQCAPATCPCTYSWSWTGPASTSGSTSGTTFTKVLTLGMYHITVVPICGNNKCKQCDFYLSVQP